MVLFIKTYEALNFISENLIYNTPYNNFYKCVNKFIRIWTLYTIDCT